jgi:hypothetical protein
LAPADYTATNGTTVVLNNACVAGDVVVVEVYNLVSIANALPSTGGTVTGATTFNSSVTINGGSASGYTGYKNRIINGGMVIDQRNNGASVTPPASPTYTLDRWAANWTQASKYSVQQSSIASTGFSKSLLVTSLAATSVGTGDFYAFQQVIEGFNIADLGFGTANAQTVTISFDVRSSLTGTFGGCLTNGAHNRSYPFTFTINSANTFERKSITIAGDTSGTWPTDNTAGMRLWFGLGSGSTYAGTAGAWSGSTFVTATGATSVVGTNGATFYITGVQLERGNATSFEFRDFGRELIMCQRYYEKSDGQNTSLFWSGNTNSSATYYFPVKYAVAKRSTPTTTITDISNSGFPSTITVGQESTVGFRADSTSNSTGAGNYYRANWASTSEL